MSDKIANFFAILFYIFMASILGWMAFRAGFPELVIALPDQKDWIDYLAAWSGPMAGFAAIFIAIGNNQQTNKRFDKQMNAELSLDRKAANRQQIEWNQRYLAARRTEIRDYIRLLEWLSEEWNINACRMDDAIHQAKDGKGFGKIELDIPAHDSVGTQPWRLPHDYREWDWCYTMQQTVKAANKVIETIDDTGNSTCTAEDFIEQARIVEKELMVAMNKVDEFVGFLDKDFDELTDYDEFM